MVNIDYLLTSNPPKNNSKSLPQAPGLSNLCFIIVFSIQTFKEINQLELVRQAGIRQQYMDQAVSLNLKRKNLSILLK